MANQRVDSILTSGPLPPGAAFDIAIAVAHRMATAGNVGPILLRPDRVAISPDGAVTLIGQRMPGATAEGDAYGLGGLLVHMIVGAPYSKEQHDACLREVKAALELWPGGPDAIAAMEWLLAMDAKRPSGVTAQAVHDRLADVRTRLGGSLLIDFLRNLQSAQASQPSSEFGGSEPMNPELATGMIPVGALAKLVAQGAPPSAAPAEAPAPEASGPLDLKSSASEAATPVPASSDSGRRAGPSATLLLSGAVLWGITVILLFVALILAVYLLA